MIKRISMWRLKPDCSESDRIEMKNALLSLKQNTPSLLDVEVGLNESTSKSAYDIVFIGSFKNRSDVIDFENDPYHKQVGQLVDSLKLTRSVVEYCTDEVTAD
ncbi:MAG: Dabb family protein [Gammaproteobacteria bacterium]|nr:Dabb family protein [Gammaproteobacteria bacterium]